MMMSSSMSTFMMHGALCIPGDDLTYYPPKPPVKADEVADVDGDDTTVYTVATLVKILLWFALIGIGTCASALLANAIGI